jgi:pseudouridylate synthase
MPTDLGELLQIHPEIRQALQSQRPITALETTVITHGLPYPHNLQLAADMESEVRKQGCFAATIGVMDGVIKIGFEPNEIAELVQKDNLHKLSSRDLGTAVALGWSGGTTVAGSILAAHMAGIQVFATGGIGGVHRGSTRDISADLTQLAETPVLVVCSGAKSILDLPATLEFLETCSVPVVGYQTEEFPAFFSRTSGLPLGVKVDNPEQAALIARAHWHLGSRSAVLICVPIPPEDALDSKWVDEMILKAQEEADLNDVHGQRITPFLLQRVNELTGERSLQANLSLLKNNARTAGQIAHFLA